MLKNLLRDAATLGVIAAGMVLLFIILTSTPVV